jgi:hypothetical protein
MRVKNAVAVLVAFFLLAASSWASVCDLSCALEQAQGDCHGFASSQPAPSSEMSMNMDDTDAAGHHPQPDKDDSPSGKMNLHAKFSPGCEDTPCVQLVASANRFRSADHLAQPAGRLMSAGSAIPIGGARRSWLDASPPQQPCSAGHFLALRI